MPAETHLAAEGTLSWQGFQTWYRVVGGDGADRAPLVVCHGGPGMTHDYLSSLAALAGTGRALVFYDQLGNGRSGRRPDAPASFWTPELFVRELETLVESLGFDDGYHVLGHSWGGMLALEHATRRPRGLRSVIAFSAYGSSALFRTEVAALVAALPAETRAAIERHEAAGTVESDEYQQAVRVFYREHVCRTRPVPPEVVRTLTAMGQDSTVYTAMAGPSEFTMTGSLRDWDITDRLAAVDVPVLLVSGRHDEVTPTAVSQLREALPSAEWELFEESSHMAHLEEPARFHRTVTGFLAKNDVATR
ncbi:proline iminopeptidase-family hydrolase [Amycolatopsis sp. H20-H5]|uniref:proline iminopeptidase-family hydrolase n=1 Tax=Amycolatopsis sp. H20-H5 TaxID=3046309 RepID=UPI002DBAFED3|nr:proline iminopeptidase-family hydrolase [Amycolatopsis sp. H20-H5]MEC3975008.1 proline iminopeptidase-family hydrolase [Amycolatopsis sp. H20-H5]